MPPLKSHMVFIETQDPPLTATALLALDEAQIAQYLEEGDDSDGGYVIFRLDGVEDLSSSQQDELAEKLRAAASQVEHGKTSHALKIDELLARLTSVAGEQNGSPKCTSSRPSAETLDPTEATPPPINVVEAEASSYRELIKSGGRPVCSIEDLSHILTKPTTGYKTLLPWLSDHPDSEHGDGEIKSVFTRQFTRWWDFRRSQWDNRGKGNGDEGFPAFLEACRSKYEGMGAHEMVSSSSFEATIRRQWQQKSTSRQVRVPDGQPFSAYRDAVKRHLTRHHFARPLQLKKDPRQQNEWTNWLEYLNYEQWWLEGQTAAAESLEEHNHHAWQNLLQARRVSSHKARGSHGINATSRSAASGSSHTRQRHPGATTVGLAKELKEVQARLDATDKMIDDFIRETARYRHAATAAYYQRLRVKWAIKEARLMETEILQQRKTAKSRAQVDAKGNRKRRRDDDDDDDDGEQEEDKPPEPWSKRTRRGVAARK